MLKPKFFIVLMAISMLLLGNTALFSQEEESELTGKLIFGYRYVDSSGSENKYKEDINLNSGARLMTLQLHYNPKVKEGKWVDEASLWLDNFGGDPFESFSFQAAKYGVYTLNYQRIKADYFYADEQWTHPLTFWQMRESVGGDFHQYDFERVMDRASAKVWLGKNAHFNFSFDRFLKKGHSTTSLDIFRDEFEFDKTIHQDSQQYILSLDYSLPAISFYLEEKLGSYEDSNSLFLPGFSEGENFGYPSPNSANLYFFYIDMPYDSQSLTHTVRINAKPMKNLILKGAASLMSLDIDNFDYFEHAGGTSYNGRYTEYTADDTAFDFNRKINLFTFDLSYLLSDRLAIVGAARSHSYKQDGMLAYETTNFLPSTSTSTSEDEVSEEFNTFGFDLGAQFQATQTLSLSAGVRSESRTIKHEAPRPDSDTSHLGLYATLAWKPNAKLSTTLDYQFGDYKDQVMAVLPARMNRLRFNLRYRVSEFFAMASLLYAQLDNEDGHLYNPNITQDANGFKNTNLNLTLRAGYNGAKFSASAGLTVGQNKTTANDRRLDGATPYLPWPIFFDGDTTMFDLMLDYAVSNSVKLACYAAYYGAPANYGGYYVYQDNNNTASSAQPTFTKDEAYQNRDLSRLTIKPSISVKLENGLILSASYKLVDFKDPWTIHYTDKTVGFNNDYQANVFELSLGYRWK